MNAYSPGAAVLALAVGMLGAALSAAPVRAQAEVPVKVTVTAGGRTKTLRGTGQCGYEQRAFMYEVEGSLWMAEFSEAGQHVTLTYFRPVGGRTGDQFSLFVQSGRADHRLISLKGAQPEGSGRSTFQPTAQGGRFEITGKDQTGAPLSAAIECARFGPILAVGG